MNVSLPLAVPVDYGHSESDLQEVRREAPDFPGHIKAALRMRSHSPTHTGRIYDT